MLILLAALCFILAWIFQVFGGGPHAAVFQPAALLYLGLFFWVLASVVPWAPWKRG